MQAFIRVWVLTGDKVETAISVARSANLIMDDTKTLVLKAPEVWTRKDNQPIAFLDPEETQFDERMIDFHQQAKAFKAQEQHVVIVIDGDSLTHALASHRVSLLFSKLGLYFMSVLNLPAAAFLGIVTRLRCRDMLPGVAHSEG